jgi:hypothetical protein
MVDGCTMQLLSAVPALANAGPDCDPCGGTLKVIVQRETDILTYKRKYG